MNDRRLAWALRLFGLLDVAAAGAVLMPRAGMSAVARWSGIATLPDDPVVGYLARSGSLMYVLHGLTILYLSTDVVRYRGLIRFLAWAAIGHGIALYAIDWFEQLPLWWKSLEGGCVAATGAVVLWLLRASRPPGGDPSRTPSD